MSNPWVQNILCSLIASLLVAVAQAIFKRGYPGAQLLFATFMGTMIFGLGNVLESAVYALLQPGDSSWAAIMNSRQFAPGQFSLAFFVSGALPGILTAVMVTRGESLSTRLLNGVIWAPISLLAVDAAVLIGAYLCCAQAQPFGRNAFSVLSDVFGGAAGGLVIGAVAHVFWRISRLDAPNSKRADNASARRRIKR
jgi:hypothetical protein